MFKNIINNFVYKKVFKEISIIDLKKYYKSEFKKCFQLSLLSWSFTITMGYITLKSGSDFFPSVIFFLLLILGATFSIFVSGFTINELYGFIFAKKEMNKINEKNFDLFYVEENEREEEQFRFTGYDFTESKSNDLLSKKLSKEDLFLLTEELKKIGTSEERIKKFLKERISKKDNFDITLEDFCFLIKALNEEHEYKKNEEKRNQAENMIDNMFKKEKLSKKTILEKEKLIV